MPLLWETDSLQHSLIALEVTPFYTLKPKDMFAVGLWSWVLSIVANDMKFD